MCFSAGASFTASVIISSTGVATMRKARRPESRLFAAIPFIFGLQQLAEGAVWVTLGSAANAVLENAATYVFLAAALVIWPVIVPLSLFLIERVRSRRNILAISMGAGIAVGAYYAWRLIFFDVVPRIEGSHIVYVNNFPETFGEGMFIMYLASTILLFFVSSVPRVPVLGAAILVSFLVTVFIFAPALTSVWCFFAAVASVIIYWILAGLPERESALLTP